MSAFSDHQRSEDINCVSLSLLLAKQHQVLQILLPFPQSLAFLNVTSLNVAFIVVLKVRDGFLETPHSPLFLSSINFGRR